MRAGQATRNGPVNRVDHNEKPNRALWVAGVQLSFFFGRASIDLITDWHKRLAAPGTARLALDREWRDPPGLRLGAITR